MKKDKDKKVDCSFMMVTMACYSIEYTRKHTRIDQCVCVCVYASHPKMWRWT